MVGIGNEAFRCRISGTHGATSEMLSGRVRESWFTVILSVRGQKHAAGSPDAPEDALEQIGEQVAGNLF